MTKYVKLNAPVYGSSSYLRCESIYRKGLGYCIEIDPVEFKSGLVSMVFCKEYFALGDAGKFLVEVASRRSAKKQAEADARMEACLADYVKLYLNRIGRNDLHMVEEQGRIKAVKYNVTFMRNDVYQSNLAIAESDKAVWAWYKMYKPDAQILDISPARSDDEKPGKPCVRIDADYRPYILAADDMSLILQREKGMTCAFYVMDKRHYENLAYPKFSADNSGNQLIIGDWYVIVTCSNGCKYYVNVSCDSVMAMCAEVFNFIKNK